jgi:hypothetical protein
MPVLRGSSTCSGSFTPILAAHFVDLFLPFGEAFVPSGKRRSHMGSRYFFPSGAVCCDLSFPSRCANRGWSTAIFRDMKMKP